MGAVHVGIVGFGLSGSVFHAPIITSVPELVLYGVVSSNREKVHSAYKQVTVYENIDTLLADPVVDLVVISTPNTTHFEYAKKALEAKKHVIIEKPFVTNSEDATQLIKIAKENGKILSVYQNRRWDNDFLTIRHLLEEKVLGEIYTYEAHYDRYRPEVSGKWRDLAIEGSGMLFDLGAHMVDQALTLFGTPQTVFADIQKQRKGAQIDDYYHMILGYDKLRVILHTGSIVKLHGPRYQIHGSNGSFIKYGLDPQEEQLRRGMLPGAAGWGEDLPENYGRIQAGKTLTLTGEVVTLKGAYESYYKGMYEAITTGGKPPVTAEEALNTIKVIECAIDSAESGKVIHFS